MGKNVDRIEILEKVVSDLIDRRYPKQKNAIKGLIYGILAVVGVGAGFIAAGGFVSALFLSENPDDIHLGLHEFAVLTVIAVAAVWYVIRQDRQTKTYNEFLDSMIQGKKDEIEKLKQLPWDS
ncbi:hypothetical protein [uncultured Aquitalea sp.]|uniref:hypothetical protein n=1 Tax=uncultured Aquitalea sp. TaxID=540272 RepID=UPI0025F83264|nr:hypothetical protein [uncultured Aquitalea sp.]